MDKYPIMVYIEAAILGKVGGKMIVCDPLIVSTLQTTPAFAYSIQALFACGVIVAG
jgi:predicted tellurium resistance membrane protein TerC